MGPSYMGMGFRRTRRVWKYDCFRLVCLRAHFYLRDDRPVVPLRSLNKNLIIIKKQPVPFYENRKNLIKGDRLLFYD